MHDDVFGNLELSGAKFQMAWMPPFTISSATACATSAGVVMIPRWDTHSRGEIGELSRDNTAFS